MTARADADAPVLTRDWLTGYFRVYPLEPAVRRYAHSRIDDRTSAQRQQRNIDRTLANREEDGCWNGPCPFGEEPRAD